MRKRTNSFLVLSLVLPCCGITTIEAALPCSALPRAKQFAQDRAAASPEALFQAGQQALERGDLQEAERNFRQVLVLDPKAAPAYTNLGVIEMRRKNWDHAMTYLKKAESLSPNVPGIRLNIGLIGFRTGNYRDAVPVLQTVVRDEPRSNQARYLLGLCQIFTEDYAAAVETLKPLWEYMSNDVMYLYALDMAADKSGDKQTDEKAMNEMVRVGAGTPEFQLILAKAHLQHHEHDAALEELKKVEATDPSMPFLHFNLGFAYLGVGDYVKSELEFRKDIAIDPDLADDYYQLGIVYSFQARTEDSEKAFKEALRLDPHRPGAWFSLGKIYNERGNYPEALNAFDEALKYSPDSEKVHVIRAQVLQRMGRMDEAKAEFALSKKLLDQKLNKDREDLQEMQVPNPELKQGPH